MEAHSNKLHIRVHINIYMYLISKTRQTLIFGNELDNNYREAILYNPIKKYRCTLHI